MEDKNIAVHIILSVQSFSQHFPTFIELLKFGKLWKKMYKANFWHLASIVSDIF